MRKHVVEKDSWAWSFFTRWSRPPSWIAKERMISRRMEWPHNKRMCNEVFKLEIKHITISIYLSIYLSINERCAMQYELETLFRIDTLERVVEGVFEITFVWFE
jgi:hypothetical protein